MFTYIECDKEGLDSQYSMCKGNKKNILDTPPGNQRRVLPRRASLDELEKLLDHDRLVGPKSCRSGQNGVKEGFEVLEAREREQQMGPDELSG